MTLEKKLPTLLNHWIQHNSDHAASYLQWAEKTEAAGMAELAAMLRDIADRTIAMNDRFEKTMELLSKP